MTVIREILPIDEAFKLLVLNYEDEECAIDMAKEVIIKVRKNENKILDLKLRYIYNYGGGIVRRVTPAEIEAFSLGNDPYFISLI